jgi:choline dehydrogenase
MLISGENFDADQARSAGTFDYIVCGAGSAGCALAVRLSEDGAASILILEAGGDDTSETISDPNRWRLGHRESPPDGSESRNTPYWNPPSIQSENPTL